MYNLFNKLKPQENLRKAVITLYANAKSQFACYGSPAPKNLTLCWHTCFAQQMSVYLFNENYLLHIIYMQRLKSLLCLLLIPIIKSGSWCMSFWFSAAYCPAILVMCGALVGVLNGNDPMHKSAEF